LGNAAAARVGKIARQEVAAHQRAEHRHRQPAPCRPAGRIQAPAQVLGEQHERHYHQAHHGPDHQGQNKQYLIFVLLEPRRWVFPFPARHRIPVAHRIVHQPSKSVPRPAILSKLAALFLLGLLLQTTSHSQQLDLSTWFNFNPNGPVVAGSAVDASDLLVDSPGENPSTVIDRRGFGRASSDGHFQFTNTGSRAFGFLDLPTEATRNLLRFEPSCGSNIRAGRRPPTS
jgi:hypothetical protein